ncbi:hypothetical protein F2Q69_00013137 [Brassica cretica]|uniref:Uncharacterized protein n=1 Tax=Brassica cretica TaxID=69181 RepID=A0A8S9QSN0_BRACR|nr:hypothetical protein F2Q69_00013137 [Brassica cretica]
MFRSIPLAIPCLVTIGEKYPGVDTGFQTPADRNSGSDPCFHPCLRSQLTELQKVLGTAWENSEILSEVQNLKEMLDEALPTRS